jgi:hypothetical protein
MYMADMHRPSHGLLPLPLSRDGLEEVGRDTYFEETKRAGVRMRRVEQLIANPSTVPDALKKGLRTSGATQAVTRP